MMEEIEDLEAGEDPTNGDGTPSPAVLDALREQGRLARRASDWPAARAAFERLALLDPGNTDTMLALAEVLRLAGRVKESLQTCLKLLAADASHRGTRLEMAESLRAAGCFDDAHAIFDLLLHERPDSPEIWCALARLLMAQGKRPAGEAALRRALALSPGHAPAVAALADHLAQSGRHAEAIDLHHDSVFLAPDDPRPHARMARSLMALGRMEEAARRLDIALAVDGQCREARLARADLALLEGRLEDSWDGSGAGVPPLPGPAWTGEDLNGGPLVLFAESSLSDTIRFARLAALAAARGARVALLVPPQLIPILEVQPWVDRVLSADQPLPDDLAEAAQAPLGDLPRLLGFGLASIPEAPWIEASRRRRRPILAPPDTVLRVGIAWAGRDDAAAIPFPLFLALSDIPGVVLFSIETGIDADAAAECADPSLVTDLTPTLGDYGDLAGRIAELDAVVAADCPVAHLAAVMGKPVLALIPADSHPRWMQDTETSPWYPTLRLIRQVRGEGWRPAMARARAALSLMADDARAARNERRAQASEPLMVQRAFLEAHLAPGDLLVDALTGDGRLIPDRPDVAVLAFEPCPALAEPLRHRLGGRGNVRVVEAALGTGNEPILVSPAPRGGRRVFAIPPGLPAPMVAGALGGVLAEVPEWSGRRLVLRLEQTGWETAIFEGLGEWRPAVVVLEHRPESTAAARLTEAGYGLWALPAGQSHGVAQDFEGRAGWMLALAPGIKPAALYGNPAEVPPSPADMDSALAQAERLAAEGLIHQSARRMGEAAALYAQALMHDPFNAEANANKGVMMHMAGRRAAAAACYCRALLRSHGPGIAANLANALRELGRLDEAEQALAGALDAEPDNGDFLYGQILLRRDQGRLDEAVALARSLRERRGGLDWLLAQLLLAQGRMAEGLALFGARPTPPPPLPDTPLWQGGDMMAATLLIYQDCDTADAIMFLRLLRPLARRGALIALVCQPELAALAEDLPGVEHVLTPDEPVPPCNAQLPLSQLPRLLTRDGAPRETARIALPEHLRPRRFPRDQRLRVGLSWGGRPEDKAIGLPDLLVLAADPHLALTALGEGVDSHALAAAGAHTLLELVTPPPMDLAETAAVIAGLDVVVGGDTPELHLAAAMGKTAWVLLPDTISWRWPQGHDDSPWHPEARVFRQSKDGSWTKVLERVSAALTVLAAAKRGA